MLMTALTIMPESWCPSKAERTPPQEDQVKNLTSSHLGDGLLIIHHDTHATNYINICPCHLSNSQSTEPGSDTTTWIYMFQL